LSALKQRKNTERKNKVYNNCRQSKNIYNIGRQSKNIYNIGRQSKNIYNIGRQCLLYKMKKSRVLNIGGTLFTRKRPLRRFDEENYFYYNENTSLESAEVFDGELFVENNENEEFNEINTQISDGENSESSDEETSESSNDNNSEKLSKNEENKMYYMEMEENVVNIEQKPFDGHHTNIVTILLGMNLFKTFMFIFLNVKKLAIWTIVQKYGKGSAKMTKDVLSLIQLCLPEGNIFPKSYGSFIKVKIKYII